MVVVHQDVGDLLELSKIVFSLRVTVRWFCLGNMKEAKAESELRELGTTAKALKPTCDL